jgi:formylglycine-generating enzyme required for sulfatase activity
LYQAGLRPVTLHTFTLPSGKVRFSSVWRMTAGDRNRWDEGQGDYAQRLAVGYELPMDVSLTISHRALAGEAVLWPACPSPGDRWWRPSNPIELRHQKRIGRTFAIASHEVTVAQFLAFRKDHVCVKQYAPTRDCPVNMVSWYDAAAYCNWLSKQEGIPSAEWCYLPNKEGAYAQGMTLAADYLKRTGYRLPSEAEWEYACRAGSVTSRYYGETEELLPEYAWYTKNSQNKEMLPVGLLKPNDLGLFDMLGNASEWVQDPYVSYVPLKWRWGQPRQDNEFNSEINSRQGRVLRGGAFCIIAESARSARRDFSMPTDPDGEVGFRVARTYP